MSYQNYKFPRKTASVSKYLQASKVVYKDESEAISCVKLGLRASKGRWCFPRVNDHLREILCSVLYDVASEIENRLQHRTPLSESIFAVRFVVDEDIQKNRDDFYGTSQVSTSSIRKAA